MPVPEPGGAAAPTPGRRRMPKQRRSRELVERILTAAGELFAERGYAEVNTNLVAARAGVSVGSLYQFFADKDAILTALQEQWTIRLGAALDERLRDALDAEPAGLIDEVLDIHAALNEDPPGLLGFLLSSSTSPPAAPGVVEAIRSRLVQRLEVLAPAMPPERRETAASVTVHISNGLYAVGRSAGATDTAVRAEVRRALLSYVRTLRDDT